MSVVSRVDAFQRRHPAVGYPLAVVYKFFEDQGAYLAAIITYYAFIGLFPLLLLLVTILSYVLAGDPRLQEQIISSAMGQLPVIGSELGEPEGLGGGGAGLAVGLVGALYGALGVGLALQNAVNLAWNVPRNDRPNPVLARLRSLLLVVTAGVFVLGTTVLNAATHDVARLLGLPDRSPVVELGSRAAAVVLGTVGFTAAFRLAAAHRPALRVVLPGGFVMGVAWHVLQWAGQGFVSEIVARSSATNGVFAVVLGLMAFLFVSACVLVLCVEGVVVAHRRLHPRALLTPLTDAVRLTEADERAYTGLAQAQRHKGFEQIAVTFADPPVRGGPEQDGTAREGSGQDGHQVQGEEPQRHHRGHPGEQRLDGVARAEEAQRGAPPAT